ncbi:MAG: TonB family protein [Candidatus Eremiobacteraeota bacterium]|nr:TonB family protein [Candidatus Eremiobacteraeota bacterium]
MKPKSHERAEIIAGAIALGEATDTERVEYREHIAACPPCLESLGGEREIERVAETVGNGRDSEVWEPDVLQGVLRRAARPSRAYRYGFGLIAAVFAVLLGARALTTGNIGHPAGHATSPAADTAAALVALDKRAQRIVELPQTVKPVKAAANLPARRMVVVHNVVQMARSPVSIARVEREAQSPPSQPREFAAVTVHPKASASKIGSGKVPVWRDPSWRTVAMTTTTALSESAPAAPTHQAESINVPMQIAAAYATREAHPIGGETAINPQPPLIAYDEGAQGTTVFEVQLDERGAPVKCSITRSSGWSTLDDAVCKAAMKAKYSPKTVNGRPVAGTYTDAFTFRMSDTEKIFPNGNP